MRRDVPSINISTAPWGHHKSPAKHGAIDGKTWGKDGTSIRSFLAFLWGLVCKELFPTSKSGTTGAKGMCKSNIWN